SQSSRQISTKISGLTFPWTKVLYVSLGLVGTGLLGFGLYEVGKRLFGKPKGWYVKGKGDKNITKVYYSSSSFSTTNNSVSTLAQKNGKDTTYYWLPRNNNDLLFAEISYNVNNNTVEDQKYQYKDGKWTLSNKSGNNTNEDYIFEPVYW
ncbi:hypothetical protein QLQ80_03270, partial [Mycoplasma sp. M5725]